MPTKTKKSKSKKPRRTQDEIYAAVTNRIIDALGEGRVPWRKPWKVEGGLHKNLVSKKFYRGVNIWLLDLSAMLAEYESPYWLSFKQAKDLGGNVKKGEHGTEIVFYKRYAKETDELDENGKKKVKVIWVLRSYTVFNLEQTEGIDPKKIPEIPKAEKFSPIERAERFVKDIHNAPKLRHGGDRAYYRPGTDSIGMPKPEQFDSPEDYYATLFHEEVHATGHKSRTGRVKDWERFGSDPYAKEELVAEMGSSMVCALLGLEVDHTNTNAYIQSWVKRFEEDKRLVVQAGAKAQGACDYMMNVTYGKDDE